jgi:hypothetical protein
MPDSPESTNWRVRMVRPGITGIDHLANKAGFPELAKFSLLARPLRPADVGGTLRDVMLDRDNCVEDVNYQKVVPNQYVIEVSRRNYQRQYQPIQDNILQQWTDRLMEELFTANSRRGRKEFRFGGRLDVQVKPADDLRDYEARILCRIDNSAVNSPAPPKQKTQGAVSSAFLELVPTGQRWTLYPGINTIGRNEICQVYLDMPIVQEKRLVSGVHAYILIDRGSCTLFDGSPDGRPSANGTYVNLRRILPGGYQLKNGDAILLAALDPGAPRPDTPGVVTFYFWLGRKE